MTPMGYANVARDPLVEAIHTSIRRIVNGGWIDADNQRSVPECADWDSNSLSASETLFSGAFSSLCQSVIEQNASKLEALLTDMLVPLLGDWLDKNLPSLVERLIGEEIERITQASGEASIAHLEQVLGEPAGPVCSLPRVVEGIEGAVTMDLADAGSKSDIVGMLEIDPGGAEPSQPLLRHPARVYTEPSSSSTVEEGMQPIPPSTFDWGQKAFGRFAATMLIIAFFTAFLSAPAAGYQARCKSPTLLAEVARSAEPLAAPVRGPFRISSV
jgi:hypothetical protein